MIGRWWAHETELDWTPSPIVQRSQGPHDAHDSGSPLRTSSPGTTEKLLVQELSWPFQLGSINVFVPLKAPESSLRPWAPKPGSDLPDHAELSFPWRPSPLFRKDEGADHEFFSPLWNSEKSNASEPTLHIVPLPITCLVLKGPPLSSSFLRYQVDSP